MTDIVLESSYPPVLVWGGERLEKRLFCILARMMKKNVWRQKITDRGFLVNHLRIHLERIEDLDSVKYVLNPDYCHTARKNCPGSDLHRIRVSNAVQCQDHCNRNCRCKSIIISGPWCWLKWHECSAQQLINTPSANYYTKRGKPGAQLHHRGVRLP